MSPADSATTMLSISSGSRTITPFRDRVRPHEQETAAARRPAPPTHREGRVRAPSTLADDSLHKHRPGRSNPTLVMTPADQHDPRSQTQYKINSRRVLGWLHPLKRRAEALAQSRPSAEHPRRLAGPGRNPTAGPSMADPSKGWRRCDQDPVPILASQAECGKTGRGSENDGLGGVGEEGADVG
jgi:hypothetical protein